MKNEIITFNDPKSPIAEVFKTLRTNMQFMSNKEETLTLLVTSTVPGEGKSWITANLAITFAQAGKRVLLVDADMRKGRQHKLFELNNDKGLSNYLIMTAKEEGLNTIGEYIQTSLIDNLYVMTSGMVPPNPSELLTSQKMVDLIKYLESIFDIVIFDGTPSTIVTDAIILSKFVDSTLIVASYKQTKIDDLKQVKKNILNVGGNIAGVIANKMPTTKKEYNSGYYYENSMTTTKRSRATAHKNISAKKKIEDSEIDEVKRKLNEVELSNKKEENKSDDVDINNVLKQLSKYLESDKK